jgi:cytochrome P450
MTAAFSPSTALPSSTAFRPPAPAPRTRPVGPLGMIAILRRNPLELWSEAHYTQPILVGRTMLGERAVVSDPAAVRRVFLDNAANYRKDDLQMRVLRPGLGNGLLTSEGDDWRMQRRALAPLFSPRQVVAFTPAMHAVAAAGVERLRRQRAARPFDMAHEMSRLTLEMLEHTLFTQGLGRDASQFQTAVTRYFETAGRVDPFDLLGLPNFIPRLGRRQARGTLDFFARAVEDIVSARRALVARGEAAPHDILTLLLDAQDPETGRGMTDEDVRANIVTFIGAGHETTANALTWTFYLLSQATDWRTRVEEELDRAFDPARTDDPSDHLPITKAVLEEALRLYPPAAILSREAIDTDVLAGRRIRAGTVVTVSPFLLHRHRMLWRDPDLFDPTRFLGKNRETIDRFAYMPFGAGPRVCIGMGFALTEAVVVLAHFLRAFRFDLVPDHPVVPVQRITLRPRDGMQMILRDRHIAGT